MKRKITVKSPSPTIQKKYKPDSDSDSDLDELIAQLEDDFEPSNPNPDSVLDDFARQLETDFDSQSEIEDDIELKEINLEVEKEMGLVSDDDFSDIPDAFSPSPRTPKISGKRISPFISPSYQEPRTPFFKKYQGIAYNKIGDICYSYIVNKYRNRHNSVVTKSLELLLGSKKVEKVRPTYGFIQSYYNAIKSRSDIILIPYAIFEYARYTSYEAHEGTGHQCLIIINNILKTIEFFDPNGYTYHLEAYGSLDYDKLSYWLKPNFKGYKILNFEASCPKLGFQYYESDFPYSERDLQGYCVIWSWFIADLRLNHININFQDIQNQYINDLKKRYGERLSEYLRKFIVKYANYVYSKVRPTIPSPEMKYENTEEFDFN